MYRRNGRLNRYGSGYITCAPGATIRLQGLRRGLLRSASGALVFLEHGLLRGSLVPPAPIRELRDLTRYRKTFAARDQ
jgi:hypothetical protein